MKQNARQKVLITVEIMLGFGAIGLLEMIIAAFNWHVIMKGNALSIFRPGEIVAVATAFLVLVGFVGLLTYLYGLFNASKRKLKIRNILAIIYVLEFFAVVYLYQGI